jgi:hypothetical protein
MVDPVVAWPRDLIPHHSVPPRQLGLEGWHQKKLAYYFKPLYDQDTKAGIVQSWNDCKSSPFNIAAKVLRDPPSILQLKY